MHESLKEKYKQRRGPTKRQRRLVARVRAYEAMMRGKTAGGSAMSAAAFHAPGSLSK